MGFLSKLGSWLRVRKKDVQVLVVGLDNSGKSTVLNKLKPPEAQSTEQVPTVGFNVERFSAGSLGFTAFDMSGQGRYRNLWEHYYKETDGVIFVVDSTDRLRMAVAREELGELLGHKDVAARRIPLLFLANKMDEKSALSPAEISRLLGLDSIRGKSWHIGATCALSGDGLSEALDWLSQSIKSYLDSAHR